MEEEAKASDMYADLPPAGPIIEDGWKNRGARRRVQDSRHSKPKEIHADEYLKA